METKGHPIFYKKVYDLMKKGVVERKAVEQAQALLENYEQPEPIDELKNCIEQMTNNQFFHWVGSWFDVSIIWDQIEVWGDPVIKLELGKIKRQYGITGKIQEV